jgi:hypothetical protein
MTSLLTCLLSLVTLAPAAPPACKLETAPAQQVDAVLTYEAEFPKAEAREWVAYAPRVRDLPGQVKTLSSLEPGGTPASEVGGPRRPLWIARIPGPPDHLQAMTLCYKVKADLLSRRLVELKPDEMPPHVPPLDDRERKAALLSHGEIDLNDPQFREWLDKYKLHRDQDESDLDFARRTFLVIKKELKYEYRARMERRTGLVCTRGKSDCAGLSDVFVAALRVNRVPARTLAGRWAKSDVPGAKLEGVEYHQWHVKAEFFGEGIGWVPLDLALAVNQKGGDELRNFGRDPGDFIVFHVDGDFTLDTINAGHKEMQFLQTPFFWAVGRGNFDELKTSQTWQVRPRRDGQPTEKGPPDETDSSAAFRPDAGAVHRGARPRRRPGHDRRRRRPGEAPGHRRRPDRAAQDRRPAVQGDLSDRGRRLLSVPARTEGA